MKRKLPPALWEHRELPDNIEEAIRKISEELRQIRKIHPLRKRE